ncbi:hypothetical protein EIP91_003432 [Steccherinum ochraceum]|uniref:F-box domain-containing protein n=1 Tax=Steccherinum ochraceum TaxID=92696 RepID=A0A4R0RGV4_9APHY|nr:hypothetical protein EIP91_003432 [Steccherinum ochraceum]
MMRRLRWLALDSINLSSTHPLIFQTFTLFPALEYLALENVQYSRYAQLARLASAVRARKLYLWNALRVTPRALLDVPEGTTLDGNLSLLSPHLTDISISIPWPQLIQFVKSWTFASAPVGPLHIRFYTTAEWTEEGALGLIVQNAFAAVAEIFKRIRRLSPEHPFSVTTTVSSKTGDTVNLRRGKQIRNQFWKSR